jgi:hypothetical protein
VAEEPSQLESGIHPKLTNPLSEETRKERVYLLGMSAVGITIVFTGLIPTEISTLGIKFAEADRKSLLFIFALVVGYFLVAFGSYALSDYLEWWSARRDLALRRRRRDSKEERAKIQEELDRIASERSLREAAEKLGEAAVEKGETKRQEEEHRRQEEELEQGGMKRIRQDMEAQQRQRQEEEEHLREQSRRYRLAELDQYEQQIAADSDAPFAFTGSIITLRFVFEFIVPPLVGVFAIVALLMRAL